MDNTKKLLSLVDYEEREGSSFFDYLRERKNPVYLFSAEKAAEILDKAAVLKEADKVMSHDIFGVKFDGEIDYLYNPTTETSRDNEWSWSLFRTIYWQSLARAYALTKDEKYPKEFVHQMEQFISVWPAEKYIEDMTFEVKTPFPGHAWRTIETGIRVYTTWLPCFEIFRSSPSFTDEAISDFLLALRDHARFLMTHYSNHDRSSNWLSMEASALLQIGIMFPEFKEAKTWRETGYQRVMHEIMYCFSDNGIHMERTPIYHLVAAIAFTQAIVLSEKNGLYVPDYAKELLKRAGEYVYSLIKPDLSTPMIGDADRDDLTTVRSDTSIYEGMNLSFFPEDLNEMRAYFKWMYELTGSESFLYFATERREGKAPRALDYKYAAEGLYVARTGWGEHDDYALMHSSILERGEKSTHSHNDALHVDLSLGGTDILVDSGRYIYRSSIWKDWRAYFCSAEAHNTLSVDGHEMGEVPNVTRVRGVRAMCHQFGNIDSVKVIDLSHNGYVFMADPVFHRRKLLLIPGHRAIIIDYVNSNGAMDHDMALSFNFNRGEVKKDQRMIYSFKADNGKAFNALFSSDAEFEESLYYGSEDPKGGWISYGYPVRIPSPQLRFTRKGKAAFTFVSVFSKEGDDSYVAISKDKIDVSFYNLRLEIEKEAVEVICK